MKLSGIRWWRVLPCSKQTIRAASGTDPGAGQPGLLQSRARYAAQVTYRLYATISIIGINSINAHTTSFVTKRRRPDWPDSAAKNLYSA